MWDTKEFSKNAETQTKRSSFLNMISNSVFFFNVENWNRSLITLKIRHAVLNSMRQRNSGTKRWTKVAPVRKSIDTLDIAPPALPPPPTPTPHRGNTGIAEIPGSIRFTAQRVGVRGHESGVTPRQKIQLAPKIPTFLENKKLFFCFAFHCNLFFFFFFYCLMHF